jgi:hypothetical protein
MPLCLPDLFVTVLTRTSHSYRAASHHVNASHVDGTVDLPQDTCSAFQHACHISTDAALAHLQQTRSSSPRQPLSGTARGSNPRLRSTYTDSLGATLVLSSLSAPPSGERPRPVSLRRLRCALTLNRNLCS